MFANFNLRMTDEFYNFIKDHLPETEDQKCYVEVGAFRGDHLIAMADLFDIAYGIDLWTDLSKGDNGFFGIHNMHMCQENLNKLNIKNTHLIRGHGSEVVKTFKDNSVDMVYIDAEHSYESVKRDLLDWIPKVKPGGIISGHDYDNGSPGAIQAVDEILGKPYRIFENPNDCFFHKYFPTGSKNCPPSFIVFKK